ncbi:sigma 54-interacting transcriptional regulator [Brevibacillus nitrificans]|nr:sigma 54-interacting transcriptional regulator [Brevibacillus nitrificans]
MTTYEFVNHRFTIPDGLGELTDFIPSGLMKTYLDQLQEWFIIVNSELRIVYANQKAKNWFETEIEGKTIFDVFHISEQQSIIVQVFHTGEPVLNRVQTYYDSPHGKLRASIASTYPVVRNNQVIGVIELGEDVTGYNNLSEQIMHNLISDMKSRGSLPQKRAVRYTLDSIVGESHVIHEMKDDIVKAANSHASVLICGETGTGKELVAQSIYALGNDPNAPFIAQNCAAIPESLLEGMLFGTVKGAYTGAETRTGLFELANNGILFLDEINSMPLSLQAKILRVLEEKNFAV